MAFVRKSISKEQAVQRLETLCVRGEQCRYDLQEKLRRWGIPTAEHEAILDALEDKRFFSDERFARAFAHDKLMFNRWGKMKIAMSLRMKRLSSRLIREVLEEIDPEEYRKVAREFLAAKARQIGDLDSYENRTKLYGAGLRRGFDSELVGKIIKSLS